MEFVCLFDLLASVLRAPRLEEIRGILLAWLLCLFPRSMAAEMLWSWFLSGAGGRGDALDLFAWLNLVGKVLT